MVAAQALVVEERARNGGKATGLVHKSAKGTTNFISTLFATLVFAFGQ
jgi:hypothetical protein